MFDIGASELLVIVVIAVIAIGPKDMPRALRTAGKWIGKVRRVSTHFRTGLDAMVREAELEEMEEKWKAQNAAIMAREEPNADVGAGEGGGVAASDPHPDADDPVMTGPPVSPDVSANAKPGASSAASAESRAKPTEKPTRAGRKPSRANPGEPQSSSPQLPLDLPQADKSGPD